MRTPSINLLEIRPLFIRWRRPSPCETPTKLKAVYATPSSISEPHTTRQSDVTQRLFTPDKTNQNECHCNRIVGFNGICFNWLHRTSMLSPWTINGSKICKSDVGRDCWSSSSFRNSILERLFQILPEGSPISTRILNWSSTKLTCLVSGSNARTSYNPEQNFVKKLLHRWYFTQNLQTLIFSTFQCQHQSSTWKSFARR